MTGLVILAAVVALWTMPGIIPVHLHGRDEHNAMASWASATRSHAIAWAVVCVAMVAGLVTWAVLR